MFKTDNHDQKATRVLFVYVPARESAVVDIEECSRFHFRRVEEDAEEDEKDEDTVAAHQLVDQHENFEQLVVCFRILIAACGVLGPIRFVDFNLSCV